MATDPAGNVYVAERNHRVQKFGSSGAFLTKWGAFGAGDGQFVAPEDIATDSAGNVYVADESNHRIQKFSSSGTFPPSGALGLGQRQLSSPNGVATDSAGNVYVADTGNHRIQKFSSAGTFITKWGAFGSGNGRLVSRGRSHRLCRQSLRGRCEQQPGPEAQRLWCLRHQVGRPRLRRRAVCQPAERDDGRLRQRLRQRHQ